MGSEKLQQILFYAPNILKWGKLTNKGQRPLFSLVKILKILKSQQHHSMLIFSPQGLFADSPLPRFSLSNYFHFIFTAFSLQTTLQCSPRCLKKHLKEHKPFKAAFHLSSSKRNLPSWFLCMQGMDWSMQFAFPGSSETTGTSSQ